jgi:glycosyltransferase involved in cell wall biosynthesis
MAARAPVVVADTGGFSEVVEHNQTGVKVYHNNVDSLSWGIIKVLTDDDYANYLKANASKKVLEQYSWNQIAVRTKKVYERVLAEYDKGTWKPITVS